MAATFIYNGHTFTPAPLVTYSRETIRDGDNNSIGSRITLSCNGTLLNPDTDFEGLDQEKFRPVLEALSEDYKELRITHASGVWSAASGYITELSSGVSGVYPRIENFATEESTWNTILRFSFDAIWEEYGAGSGFVDSFSNNWSFDEQDDNTVAVSHSVTAKGINTNPTGTSNSITNARAFVNARLGLANIPAGLPARAYEFYAAQSYISGLRTESVDVDAGQYSVTENFVMGSGSGLTAIERRTFDINTDEERTTTVSVNGTVTGNGTTAESRYTNALAHYLSIEGNTLYLSASGAYGDFGHTKYLSPVVLGSSKTVNKNRGTIEYKREYSDRVNDPSGSNIISSEYDVDIDLPVAVYREFEVPGKQDGPVVQSIDTITLGSYTLSGSVVGTSLAAAKAYANVLINRHGGQAYGTAPVIKSASVKERREKNSVSFNIVWRFRGNGATSVLP